MSKTAKQPNPIDIHVGSRIRLQRNLQNMTQQQLSKQLGVTFQQIQKYEKGTNRVGASRLQALAEILRVPVSFFFSDAGGDAEPGADLSGFAESEAPEFPAPDSCTSAEGTQLMRAFIKIRDPQVRRKIIDLAKALADTDGSISL